MWKRSIWPPLLLTAIESDHWAGGGAGAAPLAEAVVAEIDKGKAAFKPLYADDMPLREKVRTIAQKIYRAKDIGGDDTADSDIDPTDGRVSVTVGTDREEIDAGLAAGAEPGLRGIVFFDVNGNGAQDADERGLSGVTITGAVIFLSCKPLITLRQILDRSRSSERTPASRV